MSTKPSTTSSDPELLRHAERYRNASPATIEAELEALGSDYQANGYTTRSQADSLGAVLGLEAEHLLVDIGSGCGWPGLYLAHTHQCQVLSLDPVGVGSRAAARRASADGVGDRAWSAVGFGEGPPVRSSIADAVVHADVLC